MHIDYSAEPVKIALTLIEDIRHRLDDSEKGLAELLLNPVPSALAKDIFAFEKVILGIRRQPHNA